jgi:coniferyl-aldehyde dehydrogenase
MNHPVHSTDEDRIAIAALRLAFAAQKAAFLKNPYPSLTERRAHLHALAEAVLANRQRIREALHADFGFHPEACADLIEVHGVAARAMGAARHVKQWMRPEKRPVDRLAFGSSRTMVARQPKGVIGNIVPWNFPFDLAFGPLIDMLAAGNRVIIKMSEYTPACGELVRDIIGKIFEADHVTVVNGGVELAKTFATLRWDHLLFTGNPQVGAAVAQAAAANLVPVTLELGGKNPAIFLEDGVTAENLEVVLGVKLVKNGQMCISIDHCLVPRSKLEDFVALARAEFAGDLENYSRSDSCTGIVSPRHFQRQLQLLEEARTAGCRVVQLDELGAVDVATRRMPMSLVIDPDPSLRVMQEEIFGPILPVIPYDSLDETLARINAGERPLALYVFTDDKAIAEKVQRQTVSGGMCVNTCGAHGAVHDLGFGGIGHSGTGRHHGIDGFREFSNPRGLFVRGKGGGFKTFMPPYTAEKRRKIEQLFGLRRLLLRVSKAFA